MLAKCLQVIIYQLYNWTRICSCSFRSSWSHRALGSTSEMHRMHYAQSIHGIDVQKNLASSPKMSFGRRRIELTSGRRDCGSLRRVVATDHDFSVTSTDLGLY